MARLPGSYRDIRVSPRNQRLLKWLRRKPQPALVVGETVDGEELKCVVSVTGPTQWSDVLSVVRACVKFEARNKDGETLRAIELDPDDPELKAENELEAAQTRALAGVPASVPLISVDIPKLVDNIARNIREASSEAARQQAGAFKDGFGAMTNVVNLCLNLLMRVDERMAELEANANTVPTTAEPSPVDARQQMAMMALKQAMGGGGNGTPAGGVDMAKLLQLLQMLQQQTQGQPPPPEAE